MGTGVARVGAGVRAGARVPVATATGAAVGVAELVGDGSGVLAGIGVGDEEGAVGSGLDAVRVGELAAAAVAAEAGVSGGGAGWPAGTAHAATRTMPTKAARRPFIPSGRQSYRAACQRGEGSAASQGRAERALPLGAYAAEGSHTRLKRPPRAATWRYALGSPARLGRRGRPPSRTWPQRAYELLARGDLPRVKVGRRTLVPVQALREWVQRASVASAVTTEGPESGGSRPLLRALQRTA